MAETIRFYLLDIGYSIVDDAPHIIIYGRTEDGRRITLHDREFLPYFYAFGSKGKIEGTAVEKKGFTAKIIRTEETEKEYFGKKQKAFQVFVNIPKGVPAIAAELKEKKRITSAHEYDIHFIRRYIIDKGLLPLGMHEAVTEDNFILSIKPIEGDYLKHADIMAFDIETYTKGTMPIPLQDPIIMLSLYGKGYRKVLTWKKIKAKHVEYVEDEAALIRKFKEIIAERQPDIITGYNSDSFDFTYIAERAKQHKIRLDIGLDGSNIKFGRGQTASARIEGIIHIDVLQFIWKNIGQSLKTDSYKLGLVAEEVLGEKKKEADIAAIGEAWDKGKGLEAYAEYNLHDSKLTYELCMKFLPNIIEFTRLSSMPAFDITRAGFSQIVEGYLLKLSKKKGIIAPSKPGHEQIRERRRETYQGAFVFQPTPGLYRNIAVFDFRSLYPTIISSHNIDPGTLMCACCKGKADIAPTDEKKYYFCSKKEGFIPSIIEDVIERRAKIKEKLKKKYDVLLDARQYSLKIMANSIYGYLAFFGSRWYSIECARSITGYARYHIKDVIAKAESAGFKVIYSDTDSVFLTLDSRTKKDAKDFCSRINKDLPGIMELELEGYFTSGIFVSAKMSQTGAKKKYALLGQDGKLKITGFETVRRNWSEIAKELQEDVLLTILKEENTAKALRSTRKVIDDLRNHKIPINKILIRTQITRPLDQYEAIGPHVSIAKRMETKGMKISPGTIVSYVICKGKGILRDRSKLPEECGTDEYDADYYINNQILPSVENIFAVLGIPKDDIIGSGDQKDLKSFFS